MGKLHTVARGLLCACAVSWFTSSQLLAEEEVVFELITPPGEIIPGAQISIVARLAGNEDPNQLIGYTLDIDIFPDVGATGTVIGDALLSSFFESENLITQGGGTIHPLASLIIDQGDGGLLVNALEENLVPVQLAGPGHDAFAELIFGVSEDALGMFTIDVGLSVSVLLNGDLGAIDFDVAPLTFEVIPEPAAVTVLALLGVMALGRRSRSTARKNRRARP